MRISDWSSDVCSSDLVGHLEKKLGVAAAQHRFGQILSIAMPHLSDRLKAKYDRRPELAPLGEQPGEIVDARQVGELVEDEPDAALGRRRKPEHRTRGTFEPAGEQRLRRLEIILRSEEHTSELQSLMRTSYAVFCLKKKNKPNNHV